MNIWFWKKRLASAALRLEALEEELTLSLNNLKLTLTSSPLKIHIAANEGKTVQRLTIDEQTGAVDFERG